MLSIGATHVVGSTFALWSVCYTGTIFSVRRRLRDLNRQEFGYKPCRAAVVPDLCIIRLPVAAMHIFDNATGTAKRPWVLKYQLGIMKPVFSKQQTVYGVISCLSVITERILRRSCM
jgi:hypothetical protein